MLHFRIDAAGPIKTFDGIAKRAGDTTGLLRRWGGYFRSKAHDRADAAEGWPGLSAATRKKLEQTRTSSITVAGEIRKSYGTKLDSYLKLQQAKGSATAPADIAELRRLRSGGRVQTVGGAKGFQFAGSMRDLKRIRRENATAETWQGSKAIDRLRKRLAKAQAQRAEGKRATVGGDKRKITKHKLLGSVARQITWNVEGSKVTTLSRVPWSGVHNDGGSAGNGVTEPKRNFLRIDASDKMELSKIALEHFTGTGSR